MAEQNVITSMLDDFAQEQPIHTAICIGQDLTQVQCHQSILWHHFSVSAFLNLPFQQRYDMGVVMLDSSEMQDLDTQKMSQILVKLRDLFAKRLVVVSRLQDEKLLRALGFTQLIDKTTHEADFALWQFNILTYKHVPDWFNSKFWANPENWDKFRW
ncbi:hypothetical protein GFH30_06060 [Acinetobacter wanghuae]|uniref:Uncharacterized protein n=1 Tax=Acinetobacter wanghuae TaxID=2662362 RepID=A0A5Q0P3K1_9GAMM|nr:DUF6231 family protein [Acinetobacter wanghuae]MQW91627.1 hypothetical protein [Acinetobacter wanghuae]QGA10980.1 hypothetical protein GFH30_06060 [Acinetobacter wanghuae]